MLLRVAPLPGEFYYIEVRSLVYVNNLDFLCIGHHQMGRWCPSRDRIGVRKLLLRKQKVS